MLFVAWFFWKISYQIGTWCTHHNWNPKFDLLHDYFMLQTKLAVHGEKSYGTWLCTHPCPKFEVIWIMLGELIVPQLWDRGLLDKDCLLHFFLWTVLGTHMPRVSVQNVLSNHELVIWILEGLVKLRLTRVCE